MRRAILLLVALFLTPAARAQDAVLPAPILRATLAPAQIVVGQKATLKIEILAPNFMTAPPVFPDFQIRNAVTRSLGSVNLSEEHDDVTYAGVMHEFAVHPQEPGAYTIAGQSVTITYAAQPPASRTQTLPLPRLSFTAIIPDAAQALDPFLATTKLEISQAIEPAPKDFKVGDAVIRTVTRTADGIPAMLLPPVTFPSADGLAIYPDQPSLQDKSDSRAGTLTATRIDRATYMLRKPGDYTLPAIEIAWWNVDAQRIDTSSIAAVSLHVLPNPAAAPPPRAAPASSFVDWRTKAQALMARWPLALAVLAVAALLARYLPHALRAGYGRLQRRQARYRASEAYMFARLRRSLLGGKAGAIYAAVLAWLARLAPLGANRSIPAFLRVAHDPRLAQQLSTLETQLFAPSSARAAKGPNVWSLLWRLSGARRRLIHRPAPIMPGSLPPLNPVAAPVTAHRQRRVAR